MQLYDIELKAIQRTVKNLNARISRARISKGDDTQYVLDEMIASLPMTKSGNISASGKNLSSLNQTDLRDYLAELESIKGFLNARDLVGKIESGDGFNPSDIWLAVDYARDKGTPPDSGTVKSIVDALTDNPNEQTFLDTVRGIFEVSSGRMGVGEFEEYFDTLQGF